MVSQDVVRSYCRGSQAIAESFCFSKDVGSSFHLGTLPLHLLVSVNGFVAQMLTGSIPPSLPIFYLPSYFILMEILCLATKLEVSSTNLPGHLACYILS